MASFFVSPPFLSHPISRSSYVSSSQSSPPQPPSNQPSQPQMTNQQLSANSTKLPAALEQRSTSKPAAKTTVESTDWIATTLTRRFGIGVGLAWVGFLAFGVVSEQIKTRFEVSQQEENTRYGYRIVNQHIQSLVVLITMSFHCPSISEMLTNKKR